WRTRHLQHPDRRLSVPLFRRGDPRSSGGQAARGQLCEILLGGRFSAGDDRPVDADLLRRGAQTDQAHLYRRFRVLSARLQDRAVPGGGPPMTYTIAVRDEAVYGGLVVPRVTPSFKTSNSELIEFLKDRLRDREAGELPTRERPLYTVYVPDPAGSHNALVCCAYAAP